MGYITRSLYITCTCKIIKGHKIDFRKKKKMISRKKIYFVIFSRGPINFGPMNTLTWSNWLLLANTWTGPSPMVQVDLVQEMH